MASGIKLGTGSLVELICLLLRQRHHRTGGHDDPATGQGAAAGAKGFITRFCCEVTSGFGYEGAGVEEVGETSAHTIHQHRTRGKIPWFLA